MKKVLIVLLLLCSTVIFAEEQWDYWSYVRTYITEEHPVGEPVTVEVTLVSVENMNGVWIVEGFTTVFVMNKGISGYIGGLIGILVYGRVPEFSPGTTVKVHMTFNDVWIRAGVLTPVFRGIDYEI